jgi:hypothetical protein
MGDRLGLGDMTEAYKRGDAVDVRLDRRPDSPWLAGVVLHATEYEALVLVTDKARSVFVPIGLRTSRIRHAGTTP